MIVYIFVLRVTTDKIIYITWNNFKMHIFPYNAYKNIYFKYLVHYNNLIQFAKRYKNILNYYHSPPPKKKWVMHNETCIFFSHVFINIIQAFIIDTGEKLFK